MKIKEILLKAKALIIILAVLAAIGWGFTIYFGIKAKTPVYTSSERMEKVHSYSLLLDKSMKLIQQEQSLDVLEMDIRLIDNGPLLAEWENVVFGGNQEEDVDYYIAVIVDALKFFSK